MVQNGEETRENEKITAAWGQLNESTRSHSRKRHRKRCKRPGGRNSALVRDEYMIRELSGKGQMHEGTAGVIKKTIGRNRTPLSSFVTHSGKKKKFKTKPIERRRNSGETSPRRKEGEPRGREKDQLVFGGKKRGETVNSSHKWH